MPQNWAMLHLAWVKGSEADRQKIVAQWQPMVQPSPQKDPIRDANDAGARCELAAFVNKDTGTMMEQELLRDATDCDNLAQELRRKGGEQNLSNAATWEQFSSKLRAAAIRQSGAQQATPVKPADPRREAALAAIRRYAAFLNKDAHSVPEQEMLAVAKDCDAIAQEWRREGNLEGAAVWEQSSRNLRAGKAAYLKQIAEQQAAASPQADPRSVEAHKAEARYIAFKRKDPNTVSEQELLRTATDCDTVARELRREGGEANVANASTWDQASRNLRAGKEAWVKQWALEQAQEAAARYNAFIKRDANTVWEQELASAAKDALTAAEYNRLQGGEQNLALAAKWEQAARTVSVGKEAYVKQMAAQAANGSMTAEQFQFLWNAEESRYATAMNIIGNMSSSGYHYEIRH